MPSFVALMLLVISAETTEQKLAKLPPLERVYARAAIEGPVGKMDPRKAKVGSVGRLEVVEVLQVVDGKTLLAIAGGEPYFVTGMNTAKVVDGRKYSGLSHVFVVEGTRRYGTALGGSKQVLSLVRVDTSAADPIVAAARAEFEAKVKAYEKKNGR